MTTLTDFIALFTGLISQIIPFLASLAFLYFVWGVARFISSSGNEKEVGDSKKILIWGTVGLFVMLSLWGIISFMRTEAGLDGEVGIPLIKF
jgi:heme/copper-type cytochrome/quinol oxidase subunit 2